MAARSAMTVVSTTTIATSWGNNIRDHIVARTTSNDVSSEGQMAVNTSTDQLVIHNGSAAVQFGTYGTPTTWTATPAQTGFGGSWTSADCLYTRYGRHVTGVGEVNIASGTGTAGNVITMTTNLPVPARDTIVGNYVYLDTGAAWYSGGLLLTSTGVLYFHTDGSSTYLGAAPSLGMVTGDQFRVKFDYFAAAAT